MNETKPKNPAAVALGRLARGVPKHYSADELAKRRARWGTVAVNIRWAKYRAAQALKSAQEKGGQ